MTQRGNVVLVCETGHQHEMAPEQARRLHAEPCCWCKRPIPSVNFDAVPKWQREEIIHLVLGATAQ